MTVASTRAFEQTNPPKALPDIQASPRVIAIHPTTSCWPANILRAHIFFDQPMRTANAAHFVSLVDSHGNDCSDALLDLSDGLWTADQQTLSIMFHPGRIKTGQAAADSYGPTLIAGRSYQLIVSENMCAANEQRLAHSYCHRFQAGPPIEQCPLTITDKLTLSERTVRIPTAQPLDFLSAQSYLAVTDRSDRRIAARIAIAADGRSVFINLPDTIEESAIQKGHYVLRVHPRLEDIAGNRTDHPFERSRRIAGKTP